MSRSRYAPVFLAANFGTVFFTALRKRQFVCLPSSSSSLSRCISDSSSLPSGVQSFAAAAASGLSSCVQTSAVSAATAATTTAAVEAVSATTACPPTSQPGRPVQFEISEMDVVGCVTVMPGAFG